MKPTRSTGWTSGLYPALNEPTLVGLLAETTTRKARSPLVAIGQRAMVLNACTTTCSALVLCQSVVETNEQIEFSMRAKRTNRLRSWVQVS